MNTTQDLSPPTLHVRVVASGEVLFAGAFDRPFSIGSADGTDVRLGVRDVRPEHVEIVYVDGDWWLQAVGHANATYVGARTVTRVRLDRPETIRLGWRGPEVSFATTAPASVETPGRAARVGGDEDGPDLPDERPADGSADAPDFYDASHSADRQLAWALREAADARLSATLATQSERRRGRWVLGVGSAAVLCAFVVSIALYWVAEQRQAELESTLLDIHYQLRGQDVTVARLRALAASRVDPELDNAITEATVLRRSLGEEYEKGVRQTSLYRDLPVSPASVGATASGGFSSGGLRGTGTYPLARSEDEAIYRVARALGESELSMPSGFMSAVKREIHGYWLGRGRGRFARGVERARAQGVDRLAVETFERYGLPHQLFYMAMQESDFNPDAVGPRTRWGIAKGMWQFIPPTARRYGLATGPDAGSRVPDPLDDRHDVLKATEGAAKYLSYIYTTDAQSSGLLVIASYNWGEGRIIKGVRRLGEPQSIPSEAFDGIPETPRARSYWHFLTTYRNRMPSETKDYVMKIFAAAVIGENPRLFGFDFDNPLAPYVTAAPM